MRRRTTTMRRLGLLGAFSVLLALACNAPLAPEPTIGPPPTLGGSAAPSPTNTPLPAGQTIPAASPSPLPGSATPRPTFTPIQGPTAAASPTRPPATATRPAPATAPATATAASSGPLQFTYQITWQLDPADPGTAIASVRLDPSGGNGDYRYFRDGAEVDGPTFTYRWAACRANPGTFTVSSADGQSVSTTYYSVPPCPTPTPGA